MAERVSANAAMLMQVADRLNTVVDRVVLPGCAVTELLITSAGG